MTQYALDFSPIAPPQADRPFVNLPELRGGLDSSGQSNPATGDVPKARLIADQANANGRPVVAATNPESATEQATCVIRENTPEKLRYDCHAIDCRNPAMPGRPMCVVHARRFGSRTREALLPVGCA